MKNITLTIAILFVQILTAQVTDYVQIANQITGVLEGSKTIQQLIQQQLQVKGQLADIKHWNSQGTLSTESYLELQKTYTAYSLQMNTVVTTLEEDLKELTKIRKLKDASLNRFLERFSTKYDAQLTMAHNIYTNQFAPSLSQTTIANNGKSGIIASIIAIIEFGDILYTSLKKLFTTGQLDRDMEEQLVSFAMTTVINELDEKIRFPSWEETVDLNMQTLPLTTHSLNSNKINNLQFIQPTYVNSNPVYPPNRSRAEQYIAQPISIEETNSVYLNYYNSATLIPIQNISKGIIVGGDKNDDMISLFETSESLMVGDRFWVTLQGDFQVSFFYYDETNKRWNDPMGKGIIIGGSQRLNTPTHLPSNSQYFEITEDNEKEHFLMVLTKSSLDNKIRNQILNESHNEINLLSNLKENHPSIKLLNAIDDTGNGVSIDTEQINNAVIPVYVIINKAKTQ